jgi:hypothetical protein
MTAQGGEEAPGMAADSQEPRSLAQGVVGPARVTAFGASNVAPAGAVVGGLVIAVSYAAAAASLVLGLPLTYAYGGPRTFGYLAGAGGLSIVLIYLAVNIAAIRAFRTEFRDQFRLWRHLLIPACAAVLLLFPLWGILHPRAHTLMDLLPFTALGWLCAGVIVAGVLRARRPVAFDRLGSVFTPPLPGGADRLSVGVKPPSVREKSLK